MWYSTPQSPTSFMTTSWMHHSWCLAFARGNRGVESLTFCPRTAWRSWTILVNMRRDNCCHCRWYITSFTSFTRVWVGFPWKGNIVCCSCIVRLEDGLHWLSCFQGCYFTIYFLLEDGRLWRWYISKLQRNSVIYFLLWIHNIYILMEKVCFIPRMMYKR